MPRILIVAYGNPLRSDDGVAWRVADILAKRFSTSEVEIIRLHQLAPELADTIRGCERVIFIDAAFSKDGDSEPGAVRLEEIVVEKPDQARFSHAFSPQKVLGLGSELYGARPRAFSVTIEGGNFDHGSALTPRVANALPDVISTIERLVSEVASKRHKPRRTRRCAKG